MFDIYAKPPHQDHELKVASRRTQAAAVEYAKNLQGFGYTAVRVAGHDDGPAAAGSPEDGTGKDRVTAAQVLGVTAAPAEAEAEPETPAEGRP